MSQVNIDASLLDHRAANAGAVLSRTEEKMVEMSNGCICCTLREDLLLEVKKLADEQRFDYMLIGSTGVGDPLPVVSTFDFVDEAGESLNDVSRIDTMVTVVDALNLLSDCSSKDFLAQRGQVAGEGGDRGLATLQPLHPLHPQRFADLMEQSVPGLRVKGYVWLATRPNWVVSYSRAGNVATHEAIGQWWAASPKSHWPEVGTEIRQALEQPWTEPYGDRINEIVFIGQGLDRDAIERSWKRVHLNLTETRKGMEGWARLPAPFPSCDSVMQQ